MPKFWNFYSISGMEPLHDKTNKMTVCPAKTQISLGLCPVWSESSLGAQWVDPSFLHADSEDSDQTGRMPRLIWVFAGRTVILLVLSCGGSIVPTSHEMIFFFNMVAYSWSVKGTSLRKSRSSMTVKSSTNIVKWAPEIREENNPISEWFSLLSH